MKWLVGVLVMCAIAAAGTPQGKAGEPWSFELPPGFVELPGAGEEQAKQLRSQEAMRSADVRAYKSEDPEAVIVVMHAVVAMGDELSWDHLEQLDKGAVDAFSEQTHGSVHSTRRDHDGAYLVSDAAGDTPEGLHVELHTKYGADASHDVHWFTLQCLARPTEVAVCDSARRSMRLVIPDVATPSSEPARSSAYRAGQLVGGLLVIGLVLAIPISLGVWIFRRDRRDRERRRAQR